MKIEKVIDVIFEHFPDKIMIYLGDKLLFNGDTKSLGFCTWLENMDVYSYEYLDKRYNTILIRVIE